MGLAFAPFSRTHQGDFVGASFLMVELEKHVKCPGGRGGGIGIDGWDGMDGIGIDAAITLC